MAEIKYGQIDWEEGSVSSGNDFMKLEQGDNEVRIFTKPYQFVVHWTQDASGADRKVKCAIEDCPCCKKGIKSSCRWFLGVLDRKANNQPKLLEISSQIYIAIKSLYTSKKWGDVRNYDINIKRNPKGSQPLYNVEPDPNKGSISDEEKATAKEFLNRIDIDKYVQPSTPEEVLEKIGLPQPKTGTPKTNKSSAKASVSESDFDFSEDM